MKEKSGEKFRLSSLFFFHSKPHSYERKTLRVDRTAAEVKMAPERPAAGGESCAAGFFLCTIGCFFYLYLVK